MVGWVPFDARGTFTFLLMVLLLNQLKALAGRRRGSQGVVPTLPLAALVMLEAHERVFADLHPQPWGCSLQRGCEEEEGAAG